jgi:hypothetical protein
MVRVQRHEGRNSERQSPLAPMYSRPSKSRCILSQLERRSPAVLGYATSEWSCSSAARVQRNRTRRIPLRAGFCSYP